MDSAIATGKIWHRRLTPKPHRFVYRTSYTLFDIDRVEELFARSRLWSLGRFNLVSFRRGDFLRPLDRPLRQAVVERVAEDTGRRPSGRIFVLAHLRQWGLCFNPVSIYFCLDRAGRMDAIVADVHNTPWNERHAYVLDCRGQDGPAYRFEFDKAFHVSPFMPMDIRYDWRFHIEEDHLSVHMQLRHSDQECFQAGMRLTLEPMTESSMRRMPLRFPLMTLKVVAGIYWQALRLWLKKTPFHSHPDKVTQ
ncbi:DUF1365 domain-containing protein [Wenzhouxiangella sp. EGI_FJ10305]|uniref:DUF1365 domain-containing protein n=1 Tax=Wenzhouxiangella sp. EGI_FJ10305 TaxID=3243768 RepID=UPI0035D5780A